MTQSIFNSALTRAEFGREIAADLDNAANRLVITDRREVKAHAHRIQICNSKSNFVVSDELINLETGEEFSGTVQLWRCGSIFCPNCLARKSFRNRKIARQILTDYKQLVGYRFRFITLTVPTPAASLARTREVVNYAWTLLRKRKTWRSFVRAYIKSEEFNVNKTGYHYHIHLIVDAKFLAADRLRLMWTDAVERAFLKFNLDFIVNTESGLLMINIKMITDREAAANEVAKYITKSDSWSRLSAAALLELALVRRFSRMFEVGGEFKKRANNENNNAVPDETQFDITPKLDTRSISDGDKRRTAITHWRDDAIYDDPALSEQFEERVLRCQRFRLMQLYRRYGIQQVTDLNGLVIDLATL